MLRVCLLAPLCAAVLVKSPGDPTGSGVLLGRSPTYRLWGKVYNASYHDQVLQPSEASSEALEPETTDQPPLTENTAQDVTTEVTPQVHETQVECVDPPEPMVWKEMLSCLRKKRFVGCVSNFFSKHWRRVSMATGRKKALRRFYLPLLLLFFKFKLLVVVLGMVAALAGKSAIMSAVSLAVAAGVAIKTSLGVHGVNNKRFDADVGVQTPSADNNGGYFLQ